MAAYVRSINHMCPGDQDWSPSGQITTAGAKRSFETGDVPIPDGAEAIVRFRELRPDVTLMDLQMPGVGGVEAIKAIRAEFPHARILVLTTYDGNVQAVRAISTDILEFWARVLVTQAQQEAAAGKRRCPGYGSAICLCNPASIRLSTQVEIRTSTWAFTFPTPAPAITAGVLRRVVAFTDLKFSNSMIEAWWRSLKHQWLFIHSLDCVATIRRLVACYVDEHNRVLPHSAFLGQTPDEM